MELNTLNNQNQNKLVEALQLIANSNTKLADDKNVLKAQLMWIKSVANAALKEQAKDLNYWKNNAEEDYLTTPISVLKYISELEKLTPIELPKQITYETTR